MAKLSLTKIKNRQFPIIVEKDEDSFYVAECPLFQGCYSQGRVIGLCLEEKAAQMFLKSYRPRELSLHTI